MYQSRHVCYIYAAELIVEYTGVIYSEGRRVEVAQNQILIRSCMDAFVKVDSREEIELGSSHS